MTQPHVHSIKSNARREARKAGLDPDTTVKPSGDGWIVIRPRGPAPARGLKAKTKARGQADAAAKPAAERKPEPPRAFMTYGAACAARDATAKRAGLKADAFVIVALPQGRTAAYADSYGFVPADQAADYVVVSMGEPKAERPATPAKGPKGAKPRSRTSRAKPQPIAAGSSMQMVLNMLLQPDGAAMPDICKATGWKPHTARARISGIVAAEKLTIERKRLMDVTWYIAKRPKAEAAKEA